MRIAGCQNDGNRSKTHKRLQPLPHWLVLRYIKGTSRQRTSIRNVCCEPEKRDDGSNSVPCHCSLAAEIASQLYSKSSRYAWEGANPVQRITRFLHNMQMSLCTIALAMYGLLSLTLCGPLSHTTKTPDIETSSSPLRSRRSTDSSAVALSKRRFLDFVSLNAIEDAGQGWTCLYNQLQAFTPSGIVAQRLEDFYEDALSGALISQSFREATKTFMTLDLGDLHLRLVSNEPIVWDFLIGFLTMMVRSRSQSLDHGVLCRQIPNLFAYAAQLQRTRSGFTNRYTLLYNHQGGTVVEVELTIVAAAAAAAALVRAAAATP